MVKLSTTLLFTLQTGRAGISHVPETATLPREMCETDWKGSQIIRIISRKNDNCTIYIFIGGNFFFLNLLCRDKMKEESLEKQTTNEYILDMQGESRNSGAA